MSDAKDDSWFDAALGAERARAPAPAPPAVAGSGPSLAARSDIAPLAEPIRLGRYTLLGLIGKGGMAEVYLAKQDGPAGFEKTVVVKRIRRALAEEQRFVEMFLREARIAARLNHVNVVQIFELGEDRGEYFIAMEFLDGISLHKAARRSWAMEKSLPMEVALKCIADAALGLHHAHTLLASDGTPAPLVHRDISPDNLMLTRDGVTKVLDFGIAKDQGSDELHTRTGEIKGKVPFMSPEQIQGHPLDGRSDLWSLGVAAYWLLTGRRPFEGTTDLMTLDLVLRAAPAPLRDINPLVPTQVQDLVLALLEKERAMRIGSGLELADELNRILGPAAGLAATSSFALEMLHAPASDRERQPGSVITVAAARPLTAWLQKLGEGSLAVLENLVPPRTPTSGAQLTLPGQRDVESSPRTTTRELLALAAGEGETRRSPALALGLFGALVVALLGYLVLGRDDAAAVVEAAPPPPVDAPANIESTRGDSSAIVEPMPPAPAPPAAPAVVESDVADGPPARVKSAATPTRVIRAKGPRSVTWKSAGGVTLGRGESTLKLAEGQRALLALDDVTGARVTVPLADGQSAVDYAALPKGRLSFRVRPWAEVYLGKQRLGTTPLDPISLPAGKYTVKLVMEDKRVTRTVDVGAGGHAVLKVDMRAP